MTNQVNQEFEEWIPPYWNKNKHIDDEGVLVYSDDLTQGAFIGYRAATQASESEINSLKQRVESYKSALEAALEEKEQSKKDERTAVTHYHELQADNNRLREALEIIRMLPDLECVLYKCDLALSSTQSQSLAEHDNEVTAPYKKALEFAEYMAKSTEQLMIAINHLDEADREEDEETVEILQEKRGEHWRAVNCSIYEFRQRSDRALKVTP